MDSRKNLMFKSYGVKKQMGKSSQRSIFAQTQQLHKGQLVGRLLLQRLATGTRYRREPTWGAACAHAQYIE